MNGMSINLFLKGLFFLFLVLFSWKIIWNIGFPFALFFRPSLVLAPHQKNTALMPAFELLTLASAIAISVFIDDQQIVYNTKLVAAIGLGLVMLSYLPLVIFNFMFFKRRINRHDSE